MEIRLLGKSRLKVSTLSYGTMTFVVVGEYFKAIGATETDEARRLGDVCLEAGVNLFDAAAVYSQGRSGVTNVIVGARNEQQLRDNLNAATWELTAEEVRRLDAVSQAPAIYPYWHQRKHRAERIPQPNLAVEEPASAEAHSANAATSS